MTDALDMGRYAVFVWSAYGLAFLVLLGNVLAPLHQRRKLLREIARAATRMKGGSTS